MSYARYRAAAADVEAFGGTRLKWKLRQAEAELQAARDAALARDAAAHAKILAAEKAWQESGGAVMGLPAEPEPAKPFYRRFV